ncbi:MAG: ABC transporter substrate-binding protein, partial [Myxococcota bacterium]
MTTFTRRQRVPERIVCLTEEPTEILYALGEHERIVGISAYTERPPEAKQTKPVVSAFIGGSVKKISALEPDLVIGFSDIQAQLAHDLIKANLQVLIFNQRSLQDILDVVLMLGRLVGKSSQAEELVDGYVERLEAARARTAAQARRPKVYFEEWDEPTITSIQWVSELIELAGGENIFSERSSGKLASERFVTHD